MHKTTLAEQGPQMPVLPEKISTRSFSFRTWTMREEKELSKLRKSAKKAGVFVREVFDLMLSELDGKDWQAWRKEDKERQRHLVLNQMPYGNMLYMYLYLRLEAMGHELRVAGVRCPHCDAALPEIVADLRTLEVEVRGDKEPNESLYKLLKPFKMGDVVVTGLYVRDTPWDVMERVTPAEAESGAVKQSFIMASVVAAETDIETRATLNVAAILQNHLGKREIESLYGFIEEHNGGPMMAVELTCSECGEEFQRPLNWNYDHFFGSSSLPKKTSASGRNSSSSATASQDSATPAP